MGPLLAWMSREIYDVEQSVPLEARLMAGGRSNVTYLVVQGQNEWILRRPPLGHVMESAHDMGREHHVLSGLARAGFPAPRPIAFCDSDDVIGSPFLLMEYVHGRVISNAEEAAALSEGGASEISAALVGTLGRLHEIDVEAAGLASLGRPQGYLERQVRRWGAQWETTRTRELQDVDHLLRWLHDGVPTLPVDAPWSLVHGDFRLDNLILDQRSAEVRAVLDWEMSTLGDPVADLAVSLVYWSRPGEELRHAIPVADGVTDGPGFWDRRRIVEEYAGATGRSLDHLDFCVALACLKLAVIMESIHYRNLAGQQLGTAAAGGGSMGVAAEALARMGVRVASGHGLDALAS
jgi:aminoglycoside phosphotransferase (APT) family kinase protein